MQVYVSKDINDDEFDVICFFAFCKRLVRSPFLEAIVFSLNDYFFYYNSSSTHFWCARLKETSLTGPREQTWNAPRSSKYKLCAFRPPQAYSCSSRCPNRMFFG